MNDQRSDEVWTIDVDVTLQSLLDDPACPTLLCRALTGVYSWQLRNETTIRTALKASRRVPQWLAALLALGASVTVEGEVPLDDFLAGPVEGEVTALHVPTRGSHIRWGVAHVGRTLADEPIVAAFATVTTEADIVDKARVALTGVWPEPVRLAKAPGALAGEPLTGDRIRSVAQAVEAAVEPQGDYLGSAAYRRAMAGVLTRRALETCLAQEAGNE
jgi:CO/xanthine dehydrogenase FAD-binding subunit